MIIESGTITSLQLGLIIMSKIDRIFILNLPEAIERRWACFTANHINGMPRNDIYTFEAIPGDSFTSARALIDTAVGEGFSEFEDLYHAEKLKERPYEIKDNYGKRVYAQFFSYCQMLRQIATEDLNTIILYDDRYIRNFNYLQHMIDHLSQPELPPCDIVQLENNWHRKHDPTFSLNPKEHPRYPWFCQGPMGGSENSMFFTPKGAAFLIDHLLKNFHETTERTILLLNDDLEACDFYWTANIPIVEILEFLGSHIHEWGGNLFQPKFVGGKNG